MKLGALPLILATCDECSEHAYTRWYANHGMKHEKVFRTLCEKHNDRMLKENAANRKRLGLT